MPSFKAVDSNGTFEMKPHWEKILPNMSDDIKKTLIESVTLHMVGGGGTTKVAATRQKASDIPVALVPDALYWKFKSDLQSDLQAEIKFNGDYFSAMFLSIKFNGNAIKYLPAFMDYDYDSPWNIQVGIYSIDGVEVFGKQSKPKGVNSPKFKFSIFP